MNRGMRNYEEMESLEGGDVRAVLLEITERLTEARVMRSAEVETVINTVKLSNLV